MTLKITVTTTNIPASASATAHAASCRICHSNAPPAELYAYNGRCEDCSTEGPTPETRRQQLREIEECRNMPPEPYEAIQDQEAKIFALCSRCGRRVTGPAALKKRKICKGCKAKQTGEHAT